MKTKSVLFAAFVLIAGHVFAQAPPRTPQAPINVKVELVITEEGGTTPPVKKTMSAVVADGFMAMCARLHLHRIPALRSSAGRRL